MTLPARHAEGISRIAIRFFALSLGALTLAAAIAWGLMAWLGRPTHPPQLTFPPAFAVSSLLLGLGSLALHRAARAVRKERQPKFRFWLNAALVLGGLFVGVQTYGLWSLFPPERAPSDASLGVTAFLLALAALHGLHFIVAVLFVSFVTARAAANRYDHEYFWGVVICAWFWHVLGIVWLAILCVFAIVL